MNLFWLWGWCFERTSFILYNRFRFNMNLNLWRLTRSNLYWWCNNTFFSNYYILFHIFLFCYFCSGGLLYNWFLCFLLYIFISFNEIYLIAASRTCSFFAFDKWVWKYFSRCLYNLLLTHTFLKHTTLQILNSNLFCAVYVAWLALVENKTYLLVDSLDINSKFDYRLFFLSCCYTFIFHVY